MSAPAPGQIWKHYKGDFYRIVAIGRMESHPIIEVVIYQSLNPDFRVWVRPLDDWCAYVKPQCKMRFEQVTSNNPFVGG